MRQSFHAGQTWPRRRLSTLESVAVLFLAATFLTSCQSSDCSAGSRIHQGVSEGFHIADVVEVAARERTIDIPVLFYSTSETVPRIEIEIDTSLYRLRADAEPGRASGARRYAETGYDDLESLVTGLRMTDFSNHTRFTVSMPCLYAIWEITSFDLVLDKGGVVTSVSKLHHSVG